MAASPDQLVEGSPLSPAQLAEIPGGMLRQLLTRKALHFRDPQSGIGYDVQIEGDLFALYAHSDPDPAASRRTYQSLSALLLALLAADCRVIARTDTTPDWLLDARKGQPHAQD